MAPFPRWMYDLALEVERGIRGNNPAHIELGRLLPESLRIAARVLADYETVAAGITPTSSPGVLPESALLDTTPITPVMPLHLSPVADPGQAPAAAPTQMGPANGVTS